MKVSIIVPVFNVEKYIDRCLKSISKQMYKDLEIIIIDDGSTDSSGTICDDFARNNSSVIVVHKKNGGLSSARNAGIELATGDAMFFLDSDDYLSADCISKCVKLLNEKNGDVAIIQMKYIPEYENSEDIAATDERIELLDTQKAIEASLYQTKYTCCAPAKLYKREVVSDIRFPEGRLSEDLATCHLFLNNAKKVVYTNYYGYYYRQHGGSIMHEFNPKRMDALEWAIEIEKFCLNYYPQIIKAARCRLFNVAIHLILDMPNHVIENNKYAETLWKEIRRTRLTVLTDRKARGREKAAAIFSFFGTDLLKTVWNSKFAIKSNGN